MPLLRKQIVSVLAAFVLLLVVASPAPASLSETELTLSARAAVLIDAENCTQLYKKDAHIPLPPASLTKVMTLLLAMEDLKSGQIDWDTKITVSERAWRTGANESQMFLDIGQQVPFKDLLKGIAIVSANDACIAVAEHLSGSVEAFVQRMNRRAVELGLENSHFANVHGLDEPDHYMSAMDAACLASFFIRTQPEASAFHSEKELTFNGIRQFNYNSLLGAYPGVDGLKTGSTSEAGYCLISTGKQQGMRLIAVVLNSAGKDLRDKDSITLLNYGFCNFEMKTLYKEGEVITTVPLKRGQKKAIGLVSPEPVRVVVPFNNDGGKVIKKFDLPEEVPAPVNKGDIIGKMHLKNESGEPIATVELTAQESLKRLGFFSNLLRQIGDFFSGLWGRLVR